MPLKNLRQLTTEIDAAVHTDGPDGKTTAVGVNAVLKSLATEVTLLPQEAALAAARKADLGPDGRVPATQLPTATATTLGMVKAGAGLAIQDDGTITVGAAAQSTQNALAPASAVLAPTVDAVNTGLSAVRAAIDTEKGRIDTLVVNAPAALDTLAEIASQLAADATGAAALLATQSQHTSQLTLNTAAIAATTASLADFNSALGTKVTAVAGLGLSGNDYTGPEKTKLAALTPVVAGENIGLDTTAQPGKTVVSNTMPAASATTAGYLTSASFAAFSSKQNALASADALPEGTANLYFTPARVRATPLTGLVATPGTLAAADTELSAWGKVLSFMGTIAATVRATAFAGYAKAAAAAAIADGDTAQTAAGKLEKKVDDAVAALAAKADLTAGKVPVAQLPVATATAAGVVKPGTNLTVDATGTLNAATPTPYTLSAASATALGGVRIGANLAVDAQGVVSGAVPVALYAAPGQAVDGAMTQKATTDTTGVLSSLQTTAKTNLVAAINEVSAAATAISGLLLADQTNSTVALTKVTGLDKAVTAGVHRFAYLVRYQAAAATTGIRLSVNFSGTNTFFTANLRWIDASATASTATAAQANTQAAGAVVGAFSARAKSTTGWGTTLGVDTASADMLVVIEGHFNATGAGTLELWHGSEVAAASTIKAGTSLLINKMGILAAGTL